MFERIKVKKLNDHLYLMDDAEEATGYVVIGKSKALVIDTMIGYENVHDVVRTLTDLPLMVVNTHGHCDHIYGNVYFDEAYMNLADLPVAYRHMSDPEFIAACQKMNITMPRFRNISDGDCIDLGGLHLDIINLPGHTPGAICLLLKEDRILFTGDSINRNLWMQLPESLPVKEALDNLNGIQYLRKQADKILHGHAKDFENISLMDEVISCMQDLLETGGDADPDYTWFGGVDKIHTLRDCNVAVCYSK